MKVKELIAKLQQFDGNADIYIDLPESDAYREIEEVGHCVLGIALKADEPEGSDKL
jgi:hypothetical protein